MDRLDLLRLMVTGASTVVIPLAVVWLGHTLGRTFREKELRLRYVELAISVLQQKPEQTDAELRQWAVRVIAAYSEIALPERAQAQLVSERALPSDRMFEWQKSYYDRQFGQER